MELAALSWRAEEACLNAWPSSRTSVIGGWLARVSGGPTRRTNSVNPLKAAAFDPSPFLPEVRRLYKDAGQSVTFRVPSIAHGLDHVLTREGFGPPEAETVTLFAPSTKAPRPDAVELSDAPSEEWLETRAALNGADAPSSAIYATMLSLVCGRVQFGCIRNEGRPAAIAYGVLTRDLLVLESVVTRPDARRRGLARAVVSALMAWAAEEGVSQACLQVAAGNRAAASLYDSLGFTKALYRYHYRRASE